MSSTSASLGLATISAGSKPDWVTPTLMWRASDFAGSDRVAAAFALGAGVRGAASAHAAPAHPDMASSPTKTKRCERATDMVPSEGASGGAR